MNPSTEPILDAANKFLWSDEMQESMDGFASNYGEMFVGVTRQQAAGRAEQKLEWTEAHNEFSQLFEFHLEQFLETQPFSTEDFVAACQDGARQNHPLASCENCPARARNAPRWFSCSRLLIVRALCPAALDHGSWDNCGRTVQVVLSMIEYDNFVSLMADKAEEQALEAAAAALAFGSDDDEEDEEPEPERHHLVDDEGGAE